MVDGITTVLNGNEMRGTISRARSTERENEKRMGKTGWLAKAQ